MNTTIYFCNRVSGEKATGHFDFTSRNFLEYIEEQIYILWELEPTVRDWKQFFRRFKFARFDYHGINPVTIREEWLTSDGSEIKIVIEDV